MSDNSLDMKITNGLIVDGTGAPGYHGDVGIRDGKIVALGKVEGDANQTIDAAGHVIAPGFVDIHTHYDAQIIWDRMLSVSPWHGVTTVVMGNCGFSVAPTRPSHRDIIVRTLENVEGMTVSALQAGLGTEWPFETFPDYLDAIEDAGTAINVGALIGHTALRTYVMGEDATERTATDDEVTEMQTLVREAMEAGALGFATSKSSTHVGYEGKPVPSRVADFDEMVALASALKQAGRGGVIQATVGKELSYEEFITLNEASGCPVTWTALLAGAAINGGTAAEQLARSRELVAQGHNVIPQVTPRALNFEFQLRAPFVFEAMRMFKPVSSADHEGKKVIYQDPEFRAAFWERMSTKAPKTFFESFRGTVISEIPGRTDLDEMNLFELAEREGKTPVETMFDIGLESDLKARFRMPVANHEEDEVEELLHCKDTVIGLSDAGAHASQLCDACLTTYLLRRWVREKKSIALEEAVRMITSRPAEVFGIHGRGQLKEGFAADVVIFDPDTVGDGPLQRVYDLPSGADRLISEATGIDAVIVNGTLLRQDNQDLLDPTGPLPGRLLRNGTATHAESAQ
jgi:N-acyl-D-amino-acid deacylase